MDIAMQAAKQYQNPSRPLPPTVVQNTFEPLRNLFDGVKSNGKDDNRFFEKKFEVTTELVETEDITDLNDISKMPPATKGPIGQESVKKIIRSYEFSDDSPECIHDTVRFCHQFLKIPQDSPCTAHVGLYMRKAKMEVLEPSSTTMMRVIINYGNKDVYILNPPTKTTSTKPLDNKNDNKSDGKTNDKNEDTTTTTNSKVTKAKKNSKQTTPTIGSRRDVFVAENHFMILGPAGLCNFKVIVGSNPTIKLPDEMKGLPIRGANKSRPLIRPGNYARLTVVLDFGLCEGFGKQFGNIANDIGNNQSPALQKIIDKVGSTIKLNNMDPSQINANDIIGSLDKSDLSAIKQTDIAKIFESSNSTENNTNIHEKETDKETEIEKEIEQEIEQEMSKVLSVSTQKVEFDNEANFDVNFSNE
jgi:hypothetical protein